MYDVATPTNTPAFPSMIDLPNEILLEIICHIDQFSSFSLVSRQFRELALPYQFESLSFCDPKAEPWCEPKSIQFCRALNAGDADAVAIAPYVQRCIVKNWNYQVTGEEMPGFKCVEECAKAFAALSNLNSLAVIYTQLSHQALEYIGQLTQLRALKLIFCRFVSQNCKLFCHHLSDLTRLTSLECSAGPPGNLCRSIPLSNLKVLMTNDIGFMLHICKIEPPIRLTKLWFRMPLPALLDYLSRSASLTHLSFIDWREFQLNPLLPIPSIHLPQLRYLSAPPHFAQLFSNQPMTVLEITEGAEQVADRALEMLQGTVFPSVQKLIINYSRPQPPLPEEFLQQTFPNLRSVETKTSGVKFFSNW